jgi:transcriptional regulator with XRE-family HTH domain
MTPTELREARRKLGLNLAQMALVLGYETKGGESQAHHLETGRRKVMPAQRRLVEAYLAGYRPPDWGLKPTPADEHRGSRR